VRIEVASWCLHLEAGFGRTNGPELANRKLCWVYLDANWSFYRRCSPAEKGQEASLRRQAQGSFRLPQVGIANESDQVT